MNSFRLNTASCYWIICTNEREGKGEITDWSVERRGKWRKGRPKCTAEKQNRELPEKEESNDSFSHRFNKVNHKSIWQMHSNSTIKSRTGIRTMLVNTNFVGQKTRYQRPKRSSIIGWLIFRKISRERRNSTKKISTLHSCFLRWTKRTIGHFIQCPISPVN